MASLLTAANALSRSTASPSNGGRSPNRLLNPGNPSTLNPLAREYISSVPRTDENVNHPRAAIQAAVDYFEDSADASQRTMDEEDEDETEDEREPNGPAPSGAGQTGGIFGPRPALTTVAEDIASNETYQFMMEG